MTDDDPGLTVRRLVRGAPKAVMATHHHGRDGWPYGSLVLTAATHDGSPLLLLSDLSDHVKNLRKDRRASLLFDGTAGLKDPLTGARASVLGRLNKVADPALLTRYLNLHQTAELYAGFQDFNLYRMRVEAAHLVAGFGKIHWLTRTKLQPKNIDAKAWLAGEAALIGRLNGKHQPLVFAALGLEKAAKGLRAVAADPEGLDIQAGARRVRLEFGAIVRTPRGVPGALKRLV